MYNEFTLNVNWVNHLAQQEKCFMLEHINMSAVATEDMFLLQYETGLRAAERHIFCCSRRHVFCCSRRHIFCCNRRHTEDVSSVAEYMSPAYSTHTSTHLLLNNTLRSPYRHIFNKLFVKQYIDKLSIERDTQIITIRMHG